MSEDRVIVAGNASELIGKIMEDRGITYSELAKTMDTSRQAVQQLVTRKTNNMRVLTFVKVSDALGYDVVLVKR